MAGVAGAASVLFAFPSRIDPARTAAAVAAVAPGTPVVGMTGNGSIGPGGAIDRGCAVLALGKSTPVGIGVATGAGHNLERAARRAAVEALRGLAKAPPAVLVLMIDTRSGDAAEAVAGVYSAAGASVPIVGGGAGGAEPAQLVGDAALKDSLIVVAIGAAEAGVGTAHGCRTRGVPAIVTRSEARTIIELDGRPASEVYLERLGLAGVELGREEFEALAVTHPLAQPELSGESRLRHILGRGLDGSLECATHVPVSAAVEFTDQGPESVVDSARVAIRTALERLAAPRPAATMVFDCAGRKRAVGEAIDVEVAAMLGEIGEHRPPVAGLFSHGEIYRLRGAKGDRNHAAVVAALA